MEVLHLNQFELAKRWRMSQRTLERWRWQGIGPVYLKLGMRIVYRMSDVLAFEQRGQHTPAIHPSMEAADIAESMRGVA